MKAVSENKSAADEMGDEKLKFLARELLKTAHYNATID